MPRSSVTDVRIAAAPPPSLSRWVDSGLQSQLRLRRLRIRRRRLSFEVCRSRDSPGSLAAWHGRHDIVALATDTAAKCTNHLLLTFKYEVNNKLLASITFKEPHRREQICDVSTAPTTVNYLRGGEVERWQKCILNVFHEHPSRARFTRCILCLRV